jgi:hypothetical protein
MSRAEVTTAMVAPIRKTIRVAAPQAVAFDVFTAGMDRWWRPDHHIAPTPFAAIVVEPKTGGRWYERDAAGATCEWGKVLLWDPPGRLILSWQLTSQWQYDASFITEVEVRFVAEGPSATRLEFEHRGLEKYGADAEKVRASLDSPGGWDGALAAFAAASGAGGVARTFRPGADSARRRTSERRPSAARFRPSAPACAA